MKLIRIALIGLFSLVLSTGVYAQEEVAKKENKLVEQLGLNDTQETSMKEINKKYQPQIKAVKDDSSLKQTEKKAKLKALKADKLKEIEGVLTPEQMTKYKEIKAANKGKKGKKGKGKKGKKK